MTTLEVRFDRDSTELAARVVTSMAEQSHFIFTNSGRDFERFAKLQRSIALQIWEALSDREFAAYLILASPLFREATQNHQNTEKIVKLYENQEVKDAVKKATDEAHSA